MAPVRKLSPFTCSWATLLVLAPTAPVQRSPVKTPAGSVLFESVCRPVLSARDDASQGTNWTRLHCQKCRCWPGGLFSFCCHHTARFYITGHVPVRGQSTLACQIHSFDLIGSGSSDSSYY